MDARKRKIRKSLSGVGVKHGRRGGVLHKTRSTIREEQEHRADEVFHSRTGDDAIGDQGNGNWKNFPDGTVANGKGGLAKLKLSQKLLKVEFVRVLMTASSNTCDSHGSGDPRNCLGFAIREVYLGYDTGGKFADLMHHSRDEHQTLTYGSSVDSWL